MNANEITFGIEIETTIPAGLIRVGSHGSGLPVPQLPAWKADRDPSIAAACGREACEFVSPVYKGTEGLRQLVADIRTIKALGAEVNSSCGLHIHVGFDRSNTEATKKLASLVANFEKAIFASTGTKSRENGRWCNGLQRYGSIDTALQNAPRCRYHVLNLASEHPTVEFRAFAASLNVEKIVGYVRMCVGLVERSLTAKRTTNFTAKAVKDSSPIHRSGEGQTALTRLFYQLGWTKGRQPYTFGQLAADGIPAIDNTKRTLMKMARKYDGPVAPEASVPAPQPAIEPINGATEGYRIDWHYDGGRTSTTSYRTYGAARRRFRQQQLHPVASVVYAELWQLQINGGGWTRLARL